MPTRTLSDLCLITRSYKKILATFHHSRSRTGLVHINDNKYIENLGGGKFQLSLHGSRLITYTPEGMRMTDAGWDTATTRRTIECGSGNRVSCSSHQQDTVFNTRHQSGRLLRVETKKGVLIAPTVAPGLGGEVFCAWNQPQATHSAPVGQTCSIITAWTGGGRFKTKLPRRDARKDPKNGDIFEKEGRFYIFSAAGWSRPGKYDCTQAVLLRYFGHLYFPDKDGPAGIHFTGEQSGPNLDLALMLSGYLDDFTPTLPFFASGNLAEQQ